MGEEELCGGGRTKTAGGGNAWVVGKGGDLLLLGRWRWSDDEGSTVGGGGWAPGVVAASRNGGRGAWRGGAGVACAGRDGGAGLGGGARGRGDWGWRRGGTGTGRRLIPIVRRRDDDGCGDGKGRRRGDDGGADPDSPHETHLGCNNASGYHGLTHEKKIRFLLEESTHAKSNERT